jgi:hypothetical protein
VTKRLLASLTHAAILALKATERGRVCQHISLTNVKRSDYHTRRGGAQSPSVGTSNEGGSIICIIFSSAPVSDLRPPGGGVGGPALGRERHIPPTLPERAGELAGAPPQVRDPDGGDESCRARTAARVWAVPRRAERGTPRAAAAWAARVAIEGAEVGHPLRPERVEVEVAHACQEGGVCLHDDQRVPVLEEVADPFVAAVEAPPHRGVRSERMLRGNGRVPVRTRRWA